MKYSDCTKIAPNEIGNAKIKHDAPDMLERLRAARDGMPLLRKKYVRLIVNNLCLMTDAEFERWSNEEVLERAHGDALVAGLGIGLILSPMKRLCKSITVIEKEESVIELVEKHYDFVTVVKADIHEYMPTKKYDTIYFDIWGDFSADHMTEAKKLEKQFRPFLKRKGYMQSWVRLALRELGSCH